MDRISPLQPGGVPGLTAPITTPAEQAAPQVQGGEPTQSPAVTVDALGSQGTSDVAAQAASPEQIAQLSQAVASGQYPVDPNAIAKAIIAAFTGGQS
jgi:anti-sigma28 factor (negative regulator of flagellin synthesis)